MILSLEEFAYTISPQQPNLTGWSERDEKMIARIAAPIYSFYGENDVRADATIPNASADRGQTGLAPPRTKCKTNMMSAITSRM